MLNTPIFKNYCIKIIKRFLLTNFILLALASNSFAETEKIFGLGIQDANYNVSSVAEHVVLVESLRDISVCDNGDCTQRKSNLRVSAVVIDGGPSTDVAPPFSIFLVMHNSIEEHAVASSVHRIAFTYKSISVKRVKAGIYEFEYIGFNPSGPCLSQRKKTIIDARELSVQVRQAKKTRFFEDFTYTDPIFAQHTVLGCADN